MALVYILYIYIQGLSCCINDALALGTQYICGAPDGNTNFYPAVVTLGSLLLLGATAYQHEAEHEDTCQHAYNLFHWYTPSFVGC